LKKYIKSAPIKGVTSTS